MHEHVYDEEYIQEIALIKASGDDKAALEIRYKQYHILEQNLLYHIKRRSLELLARKAALTYMFTKIIK